MESIQYNAALAIKVESIQYNAALAITGAVKGFSRENSIKNQVWNPYNNGDGIGNFAIYLNYI